MAVPWLGARASGRLGLLSTQFFFASFLPTGSGFQITSVGTFAQCVPTVITWDIGQSLPPFNISLDIASSSTDSPLLFAGFEGSSATVTFNLPAKTLVNLALVNSGGVLDQASNLVVQAGTDTSCANGAISGAVAAVASVSSLSGFPAETSDSSTSTDASSTPTITSSTPSQLPSINHSSSSITDTTSSATEQSHSATSTSSSTSIRRSLKSPRPSRTILTIKSTSTLNPFAVPSDSSSFPIPRPTIVIPLSSSSSLSSETSGKGLQPSVIGAIVASSIFGLTLCLFLLFWWKRRRQHQRSVRHTRLREPEPREFSIRDSISVVSVQDFPLPPTGMPNPNSPTSVNATISLPTAEAIMEHRNKPLPTPDTPPSKARPSLATSASYAGPGPSASQGPMSSPLVLNSASTLTPSTAVTPFWNSRRFASRTQELGLTAGSGGGSIFDDASSDVPSTAPPPYDQYD
ncbi:hypothetical protein GSI_08548 [Ganoderma sinense ZZ0214-1]|uniref:Axial budding pattern protein 2 n=1 Tax=Ganoderma sinense ZZ0214-1 TaxID=1077348 RepID=A0A2G8S413_9APHY|nr:hypothetical protein GSI_08548 [Ganoderma sinense ZZ0214-1]